MWTLVVTLRASDRLSRRRRRPTERSAKPSTTGASKLQESPPETTITPSCTSSRFYCSIPPSAIQKPLLYLTAGNSHSTAPIDTLIPFILPYTFIPTSAWSHRAHQLEPDQQTRSTQQQQVCVGFLCHKATLCACMHSTHST